METITLSAPVTKGERTVTELTFQDPKVRHLMAVDGYDPNSAAATVALVSALTGEPELLIRELPPEDWQKIHKKAQSVYAEFSGEDGGKSNSGEKGDESENPQPAAGQAKS